MHEKFMRRCFELAALGLGKTLSNPLVGAVIVCDDLIIGEGFHQNYGEAHAEVNAIASIKDELKLCQSTLYVNLEPCSHYGKTPPCTDLIVRSGINRVVISNLDPYEQAAGRGIEKLRKSGIDVVTGILESEGRWLNRRFFSLHEKQRPYIILKWAETMDAFIDWGRTHGSGEPPLKITCPESDRLVHKWRTEEMAILIGKNTARLDNPSLTSRLWPGANPLRIVIDPRLDLESDLHIFTDGQPTWIFNAMRQSDEGALRFVRIDDPEEFHREVINYLYSQGIVSLIIEGGAGTIQRFYDAGLWDEARVFYGRMRIGRGVQTPVFTGDLISHEEIGLDVLQTFLNR